MQKNYHIFVFLLFALVFGLQSKAQPSLCSNNFCGSNFQFHGLVNDSLNCGDSLNFTIDPINFQTIFFDDFNTGVLSPGWSNTPSLMFSNPCGPGPNGQANDFHAWFGSAASFPRFLVTKPYCLACGGQISFDLRYAFQGANEPCEGPDLPQEGVSIQYQEGVGYPWITLAYFHPNGTITALNNDTSTQATGGITNFTQWGNYTFSFPPPSANNFCPQFKFRWFQDASTSAIYDHWGIDNVKIDKKPCGNMVVNWGNFPQELVANGNSLSGYLTNEAVINYYYSFPSDYCVEPCTGQLIIPIRKPKVNIIASDTVICKDQLINLMAQQNNSFIPNKDYIYSWSPDSLVSNMANNNTLASPKPDTTKFSLSVHLSNFATCASSNDLTIKVITPSSTQISVRDETCQNMNNGVAILSPTFGQANYNYELNSIPYFNVDSINGLIPGDYVLKTTDAIGCSIIDSFSIHSALPFYFDFSYSGNYCHQSNSVNVSILDTIPGSEQYFWTYDGNNHQQSSGLNEVLKFTHAGINSILLIVKNHLGCVDSTIKQVEIFPNPTSDFSFQNTCKGLPIHLTDQSSIQNPTGFNDQIVGRIWKIENVLAAIDVLNLSHTFQNTGDYNVQLITKSNHNCLDTVIKTVKSNELPTASFIAMNNCQNEAALFYDFSEVAGSNFIHKWFWEIDNQTYFDKNPNHNFNTDGVKKIKLKVETNNLCIDSVEKEITVHAVPEFDFDFSNPKGCEPHTVTVEAYNLKPGVSINDYVWNFGDGSTGSNYNTDHTYNKGIYSIQAIAYSDFGCKTIIQKEKLIEVYPKPIADFESLNHELSTINSAVKFANNSIDASSYNWLVDDGQSSTETNPTFNLHKEGFYSVQLIAQNQNQCSDTIIKSYEITGEESIFIPNAFTPNNDKINDVFKPFGSGIMSFKMQIFARWGELIYTSNHIDNGWDGKNPKNDQTYKSDVYVYVIEVVDRKGKTHYYQGHFTLLL